MHLETLLNGRPHKVWKLEIFGSLILSLEGSCIIWACDEKPRIWRHLFLAFLYLAIPPPTTQEKTEMYTQSPSEYLDTPRCPELKSFSFPLFFYFLSPSISCNTNTWYCHPSSPTHRPNHKFEVYPWLFSAPLAVSNSLLSSVHSFFLTSSQFSPLNPHCHWFGSYSKTFWLNWRSLLPIHSPCALEHLPLPPICSSH